MTNRFSGTGKLQQSSDQTFTKIPVGSIIYHYKSGITRVFDNHGTQILSANDKESPLEFTPGGGEKPATFISSVSNDAFINYQGNITYVNDKSGKLILTIIDEYPDQGGMKYPNLSRYYVSHGMERLDRRCTK